MLVKKADVDRAFRSRVYQHDPGLETDASGGSITHQREIEHILAKGSCSTQKKYITVDLKGAKRPEIPVLTGILAIWEKLRKDQRNRYFR